MQRSRPASRITIMTLICLWMGNLLQAQGPTMVSLLDELEGAANDTIRVDVLNKIARKHLDLTQFDKGLATGTEAYDLSREINYLWGEANSLESIARYYDYRNQFRRAIEGYTAAEHILQHLDDSLSMARMLNNIGLVYKNMSSYDTALICFYRSDVILRQINDTLELANTLNLKGLVYSAWGDYEESLENFMGAMELFRPIGDSIGMSVTYCNIGMVYRKLKDYSRAGDYLGIARDLNMHFGPTRQITKIYTELGMLYDDLGRRTDAIEMFEKGLSLARFYGNQREVADGFDYLGNVYHATGEYDQALNLYNRALTIRRELGIDYGVMISNLNIVAVYLSVLERPDPKPLAGRLGVPSKEQIMSLLEDALAKSRETGNFSDRERIYTCLARASAAFSGYSEAIRFQEALLHLKDSVARMNQGRSLAELQARFEHDQQEQEIGLLRSKHKVQETLMKKQHVERLIYTGSGVTLVLLIIGLMNRMLFMNRTRRELEEQNVKIADEKHKAEESEKVKEQFLSKMSHEIRIPMNTIMGSVGIMLNRDPLPEQQKYLQAIRQSSENLLVIIDDILDLTRLEAGRIRLEEVPFSITDEVANAEQILSYKAAEKGIGLKVVMDETLPQAVMGDPTRLNQVLINLAGNGIKFTEKGEVTITVAVRERDADHVRVLFEVVDTGIGIPADRLDKIFSSFTQADSETTRKYGGTGLGLTISRQLVEMQQGHMGVTSEEGKGSRFFFEIPYRITEQTGSPDIMETGISGAIMKGLRILVVEDDEFNVMVLLDSLSSSLEDARMDVAANGMEALEKWEEGDYDIILMDIELPGMSGHDVTRTIRRSGRAGNGVPIIAMTANALPQEMEDCFNSGMNDFISKPFDQDELIRKINRLMVSQQTS